MHDQQGVHATEITMWNCHNNHRIFAVYFSNLCFSANLEILASIINLAVWH